MEEQRCLTPLWPLKRAVMRAGGVKAYRAVLPFLVGMIAGEVLAAFGWNIVGVIYYPNTQLPPPNIRILPG